MADYSTESEDMISNDGEGGPVNNVIKYPLQMDYSTDEAEEDEEEEEEEKPQKKKKKTPQTEMTTADLKKLRDEEAGIKQKRFKFDKKEFLIERLFIIR